MPQSENLGMKIAATLGGDVTTTWFDNAGFVKSHGRFNPFIRLYDDRGTEIPGALQRRYGMPAGLTDFKPGYGNHSDAQAQLASMTQRAIDAGFFATFGIAPGTKVSGQTAASGFNHEFIVDVAFIFCAEGINSEIVQKFADKQPVPVDIKPELSASLDEFFSKHRKSRPERVSPLAYTAPDMKAAGVDNIHSPAGLDTFYSYIASRLTKDIQDGAVNPASDPAGDHYSFVTMDIPTFLRWQGIVAAAAAAGNTGR